MRIKYLPLILFTLQAFGSAEMEIESAVGRSREASCVSRELEEVCACLVKTLGHTRAPAVTPEALDAAGVPEHGELRYFFLTCNNLKWQNWDFVFVTRPTLWTYIHKHSLLEKGLFPITRINDSAGYICFNTRTGQVEDFYPTSIRACGALPISSGTPHHSHPTETLVVYLQRYLGEIGA